MFIERGKGKTGKILAFAKNVLLLEQQEKSLDKPVVRVIGGIHLVQADERRLEMVAKERGNLVLEKLSFFIVVVKR